MRWGDVHVDFPFPRTGRHRSVPPNLLRCPADQDVIDRQEAWAKAPTADGHVEGFTPRQGTRPEYFNPAF